MLSILVCLLKIYTIKAKGCGSNVHSRSLLQGSTAAELRRKMQCAWAQIISVQGTERIIKFGQ